AQSTTSQPCSSQPTSPQSPSPTPSTAEPATTSAAFTPTAPTTKTAIATQDSHGRSPPSLISVTLEATCMMAGLPSQQDSSSRQRTSRTSKMRFTYCVERTATRHLLPTVAASRPRKMDCWKS
ncbi:hypothetical protein Vretifemale_12433, partial [Volvox reticuliferus]